MCNDCDGGGGVGGHGGGGGSCSGDAGDIIVALSDLIYFLPHHKHTEAVFHDIQIHGNTNFIHIVLLLKKCININTLKICILTHQPVLKTSAHFRGENVVIQVHGLDSGGATPWQHWIYVLLSTS